MKGPIISGIVGAVGVAIGIIGFTQSWIDLELSHSIINSATGIDMLTGLPDSGLSGGGAVMVLIGLIGGAATSVLCFIRKGDSVRVFFFLAFFVAFLGVVMVYGDLDGMPYSHGTGYSAGIGFWMEMGASLLLFAAILCPDLK